MADFLDRGGRVYPAIPAVLPGLPRDIKNPNRLDFWRWLVSRNNPLTSRVTVNLASPKGIDRRQQGRFIFQA